MSDDQRDPLTGEDYVLDDEHSPGWLPDWMHPVAHDLTYDEAHVLILGFGTAFLLLLAAELSIFVVIVGSVLLAAYGLAKKRKGGKLRLVVSEIWYWIVGVFFGVWAGLAAYLLLEHLGIL